MLRIAMLASMAVLSTATMLNADTEHQYQTVVITDFGFFPSPPMLIRARSYSSTIRPTTPV